MRGLPQRHGHTMSPSLDDALRAHLIAGGKLTPSGLGQAAQLRTCPRCWQWIVRGLDHRRCALEVTCDPVGLTPRTELAAVLAGCRTYELWGTELERRDASKIARGMPKPVVATHRCGIKAEPDPAIIRLFVSTYRLPLTHTPTAPPY